MSIEASNELMPKAAARLSPLRVVVDVFRLPFRHFLVLLRLAAMPFAAFALLAWLTYELRYLVWSQDAPPDASLVIEVLSVELFAAVTSLCLAPFTLRWIAHLIGQECASNLWPPVNALLLRYAARLSLIYLAYKLAYWMAVGSVGMVFFYGRDFGDAQKIGAMLHIFVYLIPVIGTAGGMWMLGRLCFMLIPFNDKRLVSYKECRSFGDGLALRMFASLFAIGLPVTLIVDTSKFLNAIVFMSKLNATHQELGTFVASVFFEAATVYAPLTAIQAIIISTAIAVMYRSATASKRTDTPQSHSF